MLIKSDFISTDEDPGLRIESFAIIKLRGVTTKLNIIFFHHANFQGINVRILLECGRTNSLCALIRSKHINFTFRRSLNFALLFS